MLRYVLFVQREEDEFGVGLGSCLFSDRSSGNEGSLCSEYSSDVRRKSDDEIDPRCVEWADHLGLES